MKDRDCEVTIRNYWKEFREALTTGAFSCYDLDRAMECAFLKAYDKLWCQGKLRFVTIQDLAFEPMGRGTILEAWEHPDYERFIPKKEYITAENRFSRPETEWLYLVLGEETAIHKCAMMECRARKNDRFGFCHFTFDEKNKDLRLIDLTVADEISYLELAHLLEYGYEEWESYAYTKLLSEQISFPVDGVDDRKTEYVPFQTMAQYYISKGYSGILYGRNACVNTRNMVLFDKMVAHPTGKIEVFAAGHDRLGRR